MPKERGGGGGEAVRAGGGDVIAGWARAYAEVIKLRDRYDHECDDELHCILDDALERMEFYLTVEDGDELDLMGVKK